MCRVVYFAVINDRWVIDDDNVVLLRMKKLTTNWLTKLILIWFPKRLNLIKSSCLFFLAILFIEDSFFDDVFSLPSFASSPLRYFLGSRYLFEIILKLLVFAEFYMTKTMKNSGIHFEQTEQLFLFTLGCMKVAISRSSFAWRNQPTVCLGHHLTFPATFVHFETREYWP